jgi:hypothetical protein
MTKLDFKTMMGLKGRETLRIMRYRSIKPLILHAIQVNGPTDMQTCDAVLHAGPGDWLLCDPQGNAKLCDDLYFKKNYAPLKDSTPLEHFREPTPGGGC